MPVRAILTPPLNLTPGLLAGGTGGQRLLIEQDVARRIRQIEQFILQQHLRGSRADEARRLAQQAERVARTGSPALARRLTDEALHLVRPEEISGRPRVELPFLEDGGPLSRGERPVALGQPEGGAPPEAPGPWGPGDQEREPEIPGTKKAAKITFQDVSRDPGVSFSYPQSITPAQAEILVRLHEGEHAREAVGRALLSGRSAQVSITIHREFRPGHGMVITGGTTRVKTRPRPRMHLLVPELPTPSEPAPGDRPPPGKETAPSRPPRGRDTTPPGPAPGNETNPPSPLFPTSQPESSAPTPEQPPPQPVTPTGRPESSITAPTISPNSSVKPADGDPREGDPQNAPAPISPNPFAKPTPATGQRIDIWR